jgi:DNA-binding response OmpR family regulator
MARILMVNDESDILEMCALILRERGHEVGIAESEAGAVGCATERRPDLLVLDLVVRGTTGEQVLDSIRARIGPTPLVVVSASADGPDRARSMGADAFVAKPFAEDDLVAAVEATLGARAIHVPES